MRFKNAVLRTQYAVRTMLSVDFHTHIGKSKSDGAEVTGPEICRAVFNPKLRLSRAVVFPIDEARPGISYSRANSKIAAAVKQFPRLIGFCRLNPHAGNKALLEMERSFRIGLVGVKLHPRAEAFRPALAAGILKELNRRTRPLILHTSHEENCRPSEWFGLLSRFRDFPVILAHGGKDAFREGILVAKKLRNVYLETSTLSYHRTRMILEEVGARKIVFASDFPYSHPSVEMEKWNQIWSIKEKREILSNNALKILEPWL